MKKHLALLALAALTHASAWAATYTYTGNPYDPASLHNYTAGCGEGSCANFTSAMKQTVSFTTAAPLPANLSFDSLLPYIATFSMSDGLTTYASSDPLVELPYATVSTDASGQITYLSVDVQRWQDPGPHTGANTRIDSFSLNVTSTHNGKCTTVVPRPAPLGDGCTTSMSDGNTSWAEPGLAPPGPGGATAVPTLGEWGLLLLSALLAALGLRQRRARS